MTANASFIGNWMTFPVLITDFLDLDIENGKFTLSIAVPPGYLMEISGLCRLFRGEDPSTTRS